MHTQRSQLLLKVGEWIASAINSYPEHDSFARVEHVCRFPISLPIPERLTGSKPVYLKLDGYLKRKWRAKFASSPARTVIVSPPAADASEQL